MSQDARKNSVYSCYLRREMNAPATYTNTAHVLCTLMLGCRGLLCHAMVTTVYNFSTCTG